MAVLETCPRDLSIIKDEDRVHEFTFLRITDTSTNPETTTPVDLTDATILFTIKRSLNDADSEALVQKSTTAGTITISDEAAGEFYLKVLREDLEDLAPGDYKYDVQVTLGVETGGYDAGSRLTPIWGAYALKDTNSDRLSFIREDTNYFNLWIRFVTDATTNPITQSNANLTSATFSFWAREDPDDSGSVMGDPTVTITSALEGKIKVVFDPADSVDVDFMGEDRKELYFKLLVTLGVNTGKYLAGDVIAPLSGILTIVVDRTNT